MINPDKRTSQIPESISNNKFKKHFEKFKSNIVKPSRIYYSAEDVKTEFKILYKNKCAYCESIEHKPETEHYRPISKYKYLAYEWSNLLPACHSCNLNKKDKFPTKKPKYTGTSITNVEDLNKIEAPFIINPEIDNPENFFYFNESTGEIKAKNNNKKAKETIKICKLNRTNLIVRRKEKYDNIKLLINYLTLYSLKNSKQKIKLELFVKNLKNNTEPKNEYSALQKQIWDDFEEKVVTLFRNIPLNDFVLNEYKILNLK